MCRCTSQYDANVSRDDDNDNDDDIDSNNYNYDANISRDDDNENELTSLNDQIIDANADDDEDPIVTLVKQ